MYKNQLQELAQRSCFNLPCYGCKREGPDHAPRFKAYVNFNGEIFESPTYCTTLRQAEHSAAEVALNVLSTRGPSRSLTARVLDETGVYKNLLQETAHRAGLNLPVYTTVRSGPGHVPVFTSTVELAAMNFTGESAKTKKQAEKNAAIAAWSALKTIPNLDSLSHQTSKEKDNTEEQDEAILGRVISNFRQKDQIKQNIRRDQNQVRRRMVRGQRENGSNASLLYQKWRPMDVLMDLVSGGGTIQKQNSFVSMLPPPRTTSKILPPTNSSIDQVMVKSQVRMQEVSSPPLDEHQRDEDEWLNGKSDVNKKQIEKDYLIYGPSLTDHISTQNVKTRLLGSPSPYPTCSSHIGRSKYPHRIAQAVQIRSVIPVCAAPPSPMRHPPPPLFKEVTSSSSACAAPPSSMRYPPPLLVKEVASSSSVNSMSTNKGAEVLSVTPNFNKLHSNQPSSEFNKEATIMKKNFN